MPHAAAPTTIRLATTVLVLALALAAAGCSQPDPGAGASDRSSAEQSGSISNSAAQPSGAAPAGTGDPAGTLASPTPTTPATTTTTTTTTTPAVTSPASDALLDNRLAFVLGLFNGQSLSAREYEQAFAPPFRQAVPLEDFTQTLAQLRASGPFTVGAEQQRSAQTLAVELVAADGINILVSLEVDDAGRMVTLTATPGTPPTLEEPVGSIRDVISALEGLGRVALVASRVEAGECAPVIGTAAVDQAPTGSAFKLYVLGAVIDAIDAGDLAWTDRLVLNLRDLSLPSGTLQDQPLGTEIPVAEAAELMIVQSDNTATDLLMHQVGREAVEAAQANWGHSDPAVNIPFPTTREMFLLKTADADGMREWIEGDEAARRQILAGLRFGDLPPVEMFSGGPILPDTLEWFASPTDLCRVSARLFDRLGDPGMEPLEQILTSNSGVPDTEDLWQRILFKGGSEPGLTAGVFLVEDDRGRRFSLTASVVNPEQDFDQIQAVLLIGAGRDLLPEELS